jgi:hypothetical protein
MLVHQVAPGSGEGQPTSITPDLGPAGSRSEGPFKAQRSGMQAYQRRSVSALAAHHAQAHPPRVQ